MIGDLDLDGYPDVIVSVVNETGISLRPLILLGSGGRSGLHPQWDLLNDPAASNVTQTAFFDLWEDVSDHVHLAHSWFEYLYTCLM